jgi:hypothetical protein
MKLTSVKLDPKKKDDSTKVCEPCCGDPSKPEFPWGMQITLETEQIKKLGGLSDFDIDDKVTIKATGSIIELNKEKRQGGNDRNTVRIQIEAIALSSDSEFDKSFDEAAKKKE